MNFFITSVNDNFGIRGLILKTAYTLNAGIANYTEQNRTLFFSLSSGHAQGAYEKLYMHKYPSFSGDMTRMVLPFLWYMLYG